MKSRIVCAICQHNFVQAQRVLDSFQLKEAHYFEKSVKIYSYINLIIYTSFPIFPLYNKIPLNKSKNASVTFDRGGPYVKRPYAKMRFSKP